MSHPVANVIPFGTKVPKPGVREYLASRTCFVLLDADEIETLDLEGTRLVALDGNFFTYDIDDVTSPHDGETVLVSQDGRRYKKKVPDGFPAITNYVKYIEDFPSAQACIEAVEAYGGGTVSCRPNAAINVSTPLLVRQKNVKIDLGIGSYLNSTHPTNHILIVGDGVNQVDNFQVGRLDFWASVNKTDGKCLWLRRVVNSWLSEHIVLGQRWRYEAAGKSSPLWNGIHADLFGDLTFDGGLQGYGLATAFLANGDNLGFWGAEIKVGGKSHFIDNQINIHLAGGVGGFYPGRFSISEGLCGLKCDKSIAGINNREVWSSQIIFDNIVGPAIDFDEDSVRYWQHIDSWVSGCGRTLGALAAIRIAPNNDQLRSVIGGGFVKASKARGMEISSGFHVMDGVQGTGNVGDFLYCAGSATRVHVFDAPIDNNGGYGINAAGMTGGAFLKVVDNDFFSNALGHINKPTGGTFIAKGNTGYVTENAFFATIPAGQTSVTVAHGLDHAPAYPSVTPIGALAGGFGMQNLNATTFQIVIPSALGAAQTFWVNFA